MVSQHNPIKLISLHEIEGKISPHTNHLKHQLQERIAAFEYVYNIAGLADYIGGEIEDLNTGDWAIKKTIFPEVCIHFIYQHGDDEFPASLRILYSGERVKQLSGEDLSGITINCVNHMLRGIREANPETKLPDVCYKM